MIEIPRIVEAQSNGRVCAYIDLAHKFDTEQAVARGVNLANLLVSQPDNRGQALEIADTLVRTGAIGLLVVDLGDALVPFNQVRGLIESAQRTTTAVVLNARIFT